MSVTTFVEPHTICSLRLSTILYTHRYTGDFQSPTMDTWCSTPTQRAASPPSPLPRAAGRSTSASRAARSRSAPSKYLPPTSPGRNAYLRAGEHTYLPGSKSLTPTTFKGGPRYRECTACQQSVLQLDEQAAQQAELHQALGEAEDACTRAESVGFDLKAQLNAAQRLLDGARADRTELETRLGAALAEVESGKAAAAAAATAQLAEFRGVQSRWEAARDETAATSAKAIAQVDGLRQQLQFSEEARAQAVKAKMAAEEALRVGSAAAAAAAAAAAETAHANRAELEAVRAQLDAARARAFELQRSHDAIAEEAALAAAAQERVVAQIRDGHEKERRLLKAEAAAAAERAARWADTVKRAHDEEVATATAKLSRERADAHERTWELRTKLNEKTREAAEAAAAHSEADRERRAAQAALAAATSELAARDGAEDARRAALAAERRADSERVDGMAVELLAARRSIDAGKEREASLTAQLADARKTMELTEEKAVKAAEEAAAKEAAAREERLHLEATMLATTQQVLRERSDAEAARAALLAADGRHAEDRKAAEAAAEAARALAAEERRLRTEEREAAKVLLETAQAQLAAQKSMTEGQRVAKADAQGQADDARAQAAQAQAVVKESRAAMMELEAARVSMREQLLSARVEAEEGKAQLAGLLRTGGLYGYGH